MNSHEGNASVVSSTLSNIRAFTKDDIPEVADLHRRVFQTADHSFPALEDAYRAYFTDVYLDNPWRDTAIESLVHAERNGKITGFLGVVPRWLRIGGRVFRAAISSNFAVDTAARGLTGLMLMRSVLEGPQDITIADEANVASRRLWEGLGGTTSLLHSMRWIYPLRPCEFAISVSRQKRFLPPAVSALVQPATRVADALLARVPAFPFHAPEPGLDGEELDCDSLATCLAEVAGHESLRVEYNRSSLSWVMRRAQQMRRYGNLQKVLVRTRQGEIAGCYVYHLNNNGISEVILLSAKARFAQSVLDHLLHSARRLGAKGLSGRLEAGMMDAFSARHCLFHCGPSWMLVHSRRPELLQAFANGDVSLSRLDGEWCMHFQ